MFDLQYVFIAALIGSFAGAVTKDLCYYFLNKWRKYRQHKTWQSAWRWFSLVYEEELCNRSAEQKKETEHEVRSTTDGPG